jgi:hypothetical protein
MQYWRGRLGQFGVRRFSDRGSLLGQRVEQGAPSGYSLHQLVEAVDFAACQRNDGHALRGLISLRCRSLIFVLDVGEVAVDDQLAACLSGEVGCLRVFEAPAVGLRVML